MGGTLSSASVLTRTRTNVELKTIQKAKRAHNLEVETKLVEMEKTIAAHFLTLRIELGAEFDSSKKESIETSAVITAFQEQKRAMITDIEKHFTEFQEKTCEMKTLLGQSEVVSKKPGTSLTAL